MNDDGVGKGEKYSVTFQSLGIPFQLFEAPVEDASEYIGVGACSLCSAEAVHCFELGIGCGVIVCCEACGLETELDADDRCDGVCRRCGGLIPFRPAREDQEVLTACYACLRAGRASITQDSEYGMVRWEDAVAGLTHGVPGLRKADFELEPGEDDWVRVRIPSEHLLELVRTPTYTSIQGESWQFCCRAPMVFVGTWSREEFSRRAPDGDGEAYFNRIVSDVVPGLWEDDLHDVTGVYVFRCAHCDRMTAHWDIA